MVCIAGATPYVSAIARCRVARNATATGGEDTVLGIASSGVVADGATTQGQNAMSTVVVCGVAANGAALTGANSRFGVVVGVVASDDAIGAGDDASIVFSKGVVLNDRLTADNHAATIVVGDVHTLDRDANTTVKGDAVSKVRDEAVADRDIFSFFIVEARDSSAVAAVAGDGVTAKINRDVIELQDQTVTNSHKVLSDDVRARRGDRPATGNGFRDGEGLSNICAVTEDQQRCQLE